MMSRGFLCVFCDECRCYLHPTTHWGEVGCCLLLTIKIFRVATLSFRFVLQSKPAVTNLVKPEGALVSALSLGTIIYYHTLLEMSTLFLKFFKKIFSVSTRSG
jgi:hypothetical protein